jgi:hypothetical protein
MFCVLFPRWGGWANGGIADGFAQFALEAYQGALRREGRGFVTGEIAKWMQDLGFGGWLMAGFFGPDDTSQPGAGRRRGMRFDSGTCEIGDAGLHLRGTRCCSARDSQKEETSIIAQTLGMEVGRRRTKWKFINIHALQVIPVHRWLTAAVYYQPPMSNIYHPITQKVQVYKVHSSSLFSTEERQRQQPKG